MGPLTEKNSLAKSAPAQPLWKVLLVDEDPSDRGYYRTVLEAIGCKVWTCTSYREGTDCLGDEIFQLVVVSQGSPNFEGRRVLERAAEIDRSLPVIVIARCLDMSCYLEAMQLGAVDYLAEPVPASEIVRVAENHLQARKAA